VAEPTAILGAVTGCLALVLSVLQEIRHQRSDRVQLKITGRVDYVTGPFVEFSLTNDGRRVITVKRFEAIGPRNVRDSLDDQLLVGLPARLQETESLDIVVSGLAMSDRVLDATGFEATDTSGRSWRMNNVAFLEFQGKARAMNERVLGQKKATKLAEDRLFVAQLNDAILKKKEAK